jgi:hypothetical protein
VQANIVKRQDQRMSNTVRVDEIWDSRLKDVVF